jgi:hypothetical protein
MNKAINTLMQEEAYLALGLGSVIRFHLEKFNEAMKLVRVRILTATSEDDYCRRGDCLLPDGNPM